MKLDLNKPLVQHVARADPTKKGAVVFECKEPGCGFTAAYDTAGHYLKGHPAADPNVIHSGGYIGFAGLASTLARQVV